MYCNYILYVYLFFMCIVNILFYYIKYIYRAFIYPQGALEEIAT